VVAKVRRGNHVFITWKGDHSPRHVHVYKDGTLIVKWNLDDHVAMKGRATARVLRLIAELKREGAL
jgi:hypothetical protein